MTITTEDGILAGFQPPVPFFKASTTNKAAGIPQAVGFAATGYPAIFTPASPGLSGTTVSNTSTTGGFLPFTNPSSGNAYLAKLGACVGVTTIGLDFFDFLWYNSGIAVTTTSAQTINSVTLPSRDANGTTNGVGVTAWLYCQLATTNSSTISNTTISYTNAAGIAGSIGTLGLGGWPATATAGTFVPFNLQVGDTGVQSIQSITLGTSYVSGTINLMLIRDITYVGFVSASSGMTLDWAQLGFPQLYNGSALSFWAMPTSTTVSIVNGHVCYAWG